MKTHTFIFRLQVFTFVIALSLYLVGQLTQDTLALITTTFVAIVVSYKIIKISWAKYHFSIREWLSNLNNIFINGLEG